MSSHIRGNEFEKRVGQYLFLHGYVVQTKFRVEVGLNSSYKKEHKFDFGNQELIVECKSYDWTESNNVPSAKISILNEAMMYFHAAPKYYRKMLFIGATRQSNARISETVAEYYVRLHRHFIPDDAEIWELNEDTLEARQLKI